MCSGKVKSVDLPPMDDRLEINLKSSAWLKQKKWMVNGHPAAKKAIFWI